VLLPNPFARGIIVGLVSALGLLIGGLITLGQVMRRKLGDRLAPPPLPIESWDYVMDAHDLAGAPVSFARFRGRVLILNFWATWCRPCVAELPSLQQLHAATADLGVALACVTQEKREVVQTFLAKGAAPLPVYLVEGEAPACFRRRAIPATFVLDPAGRIVMRHVGAARWDDPAVVTFVRGLAVAAGSA
jgi:thiol-disulfide isomerase/thioredoxin